VSLATIACVAATGCGSSGAERHRTVSVQADRAVVVAEVASEPAARERGLSGRPSLGPRSGMLFTYPDRRLRTFWMKGMRFPIDIVWIDGNRVTGVERNVPVPESGVPLYRSDGPVNRVLEVGAGWAARNAIRAGAPVVIRER
jgi:uncharacterized protein